MKSYRRSPDRNCVDQPTPRRQSRASTWAVTERRHARQKLGRSPPHIAPSRNRLADRPMPSSMCCIVADVIFDHITKRYADGFEAVTDMNLTVGDGEFMILVGPSGSGKSTALRMVAGLEDITDGELRIDGEVVNQRAPRDRDIAMVFQNYALYPHMTVRENLGFALKLAKVPKDEIGKRVQTAAEILQLEEHLDRKPANLSGGQRQRVAMGRAIVRRPKVFLMDEPLSNLDAKLRVQTRAEISRIHQRLGATTIYVTHDQVEALTLGDRIAVLRAGRLQQVGSPAELYGRPDNLFVAGFIGSPAMNFLPGEIDGDRLRSPLGPVRLPDELRHALDSGPRSPGRDVIVGIRPEDIEDASLVAEPSSGHVFPARIDVLESLGSEHDAHFELASPRVSSSELDELAQDSGTADLARSRDGIQMVARLARPSRVQQGQEANLWLDTSRLYVFDPDSGRSLTRGDDARRTDRAA